MKIEEKLMTCEICGHTWDDMLWDHRCDPKDRIDTLEAKLKLAEEALKIIDGMDIEHTTHCLDSSKYHCICGASAASEALQKIKDDA